MATIPMKTIAVGLVEHHYSVTSVSTDGPVKRAVVLYAIQ